jgi:hypothetical protein
MSIDKKSLSERDICTKFITPAIMDVAGWSISQFLEEFTLGKIHVRAIRDWADVKRVKQLLSLCDALEAQLRSAEEERGRLVESVLALSAAEGLARVGAT